MTLCLIGYDTDDGDAFLFVLTSGASLSQDFFF